MRVEAQVGARRYHVRLDGPIDLSIGGRLDASDPVAFGLPPGSARPHEGEGFVTEVARGGSVNCHTVVVTPHGNGTHTECVGHIEAHPRAVLEVLSDAWIPATVVTIAPRSVRREGSDFPDVVLTRDRFEAALEGARDGFLDALVVRTLPNDASKRSQRWSDTNPPYVDPRAITYLVERGVRHLLIDLPSVDPEKDEGRLLAHRAFWDGEAGRTRTITELIFVENAVEDGPYLLNLQVAPLWLDASPSRPILFRLEETPT